MSWLLESPLARRIEHLSVVAQTWYLVFPAPRPDLGPFLAAVAPLTQLETLSFDVQLNWKIVVSRGKAEEDHGWRLQLHARDAGEIGTLGPVLRGVPPKTFSDVILPPKAPDSLVSLVAPYRSR